MADKQKYEMEFIIRTSPKVLYNMISTPSGLSEWFADDVNIRGDVYTFFWDGSEEEARLITARNGEYVKFQWVDDEDTKYFFELRIRIDALTNEVALIVTDHAEPDELDEAQLLWEGQVSELMHVLGS